MERQELSVKETMKRYPRITAHIIAESLGYATPSMAARILKDAREGRKNYCEWIAACYGGDPLPAVKDAIRNRHNHKGYMAEYKLAYALVKRAIETGEEPLLASWF
jgi:hypothetical protein